MYAYNIILQGKGNASYAYHKITIIFFIKDPYSYD